MKVSLIICTYNWKEALQLSLESVKIQTVMPFEVIIADDGSRNDTKELIESYKKTFPCNLVHVWHEDSGWRKCIIMNKAFAICKGDYIIEIDGDIIMGSHFIEDHIKEAKPNYFLTGSRGKLTPSFSEDLLNHRKNRISFISKGVTRRMNIIRIPFITKFFYNYKRNNKERGCNMSFWRNDIYNVNGYDERFIGYGFEDIDLPKRLRRLGVYKRFLKFKAIQFHLWHKAHNSKKYMTLNENIFKENNRLNVIKCNKGLNQYLMT